MNTEHFKEKLEEELRTVQKAVEENTSIGRTEDVSATERDEIADKIEDVEGGRGENVALIARKSDIKAALEKIAAGAYGVCEVGGEPIEEDRLEADPAARTCKAHM